MLVRCRLLCVWRPPRQTGRRQECDEVSPGWEAPWLLAARAVIVALIVACRLMPGRIGRPNLLTVNSSRAPLSVGAGSVLIEGRDRVMMEHRRRVWLPVQALGNYSQWLPGAVGHRRVARELLVRQVGITLKGPMGFTRVGSAWSLAYREFRFPK